MSSENDLAIINKRVPKVQKSLGIILVSLLGQNVVAELKNDIEISGLIEEADENMNLTLHHVEQVFPNGRVQHLDVAFVNGSMIRYVHIPPEINAAKHLNDYMVNIKRISKENQKQKRVTR